MVTEKQWEKFKELIRLVEKGPRVFTIGQLKAKLGIYSTQTLLDLLELADKEEWMHSQHQG